MSRVCAEHEVWMMLNLKQEAPSHLLCEAAPQLVQKTELTKYTQQRFSER
jgi:hypothetical protein